MLSAACFYDLWRVSGSFHVYSDNKVPVVSMPNALPRNDACQSAAAGPECHTQVYERRPARSLADVNHTQVLRTRTIRDSALLRRKESRAKSHAYWRMVRIMKKCEFVSELQEAAHI